jgi:hypothetical protein
MQVKTMPLVWAIVGGSVGGIFIVYGIVGYLVAPKAKKANKIPETVQEMKSIADEISRFVSSRRQYDPSNRPSWLVPGSDSWDEERRNEEVRRHTQQMTDFFSETMNLYRERFAGVVIHLVEEVMRLGYRDDELERYHQRPGNIFGIETVANRLSALAQRIGEDNG